MDHSRLAIALAGLGIGSLAVGQAVPPAEETVTLSDTVVVAVGHEAERVETPYTVWRVDEDELRLRLQAPTLMGGLDSVPGVMLQKTGHGMTSPYLRGFTSQRTVMVADGIRLNNSFMREGPNQYWNQVDAFFYNDLEVMMGPASVLYGSDAVGGVIYASSTPLTRGLADGGWQWHGGEALLRYSTAENSFSEHIEGESALNDRWSMRLGLTRQDFGTLKTGDNTDNPNTGYEQWGANVRLKYWIDDNEAVIFGYDHFDQDNVDRVHRTIYHQDFHGTLSKGKAGDLHRIYDQDRYTAFARYELREGAGFFEEIDAQVFYSRFEEYYVRYRPAKSDKYRPSDIDTAGFRLRLQTLSDFGTWNYGFEVYHDWVSSEGYDIAKDGTQTDNIQGLVADDSKYLMFGAFIQNESNLTDRLSMITGLRYDYTELDADKVDYDGVEGDMTGDWQAVTASMRLMDRIFDEDQLNLFAGASQGFRAPNLSDATREDDFGGGDESPTTDLDAERFLTLETGLKHLGDKTRLELTLYHTFIEDRIGRVKANGNGTKANLDNGYIQGVECSGEYWPVASVGLFGRIAWQYGSEDMYNSREITMGTGDYPMSRIHPLTGEVGVRWQAPEKRFWAECAVQMADEQDRYAQSEMSDNRFPPGGTPGYAVVHLRGGAKLANNTDLAVAVENLLDKEYRIHGSGVNEPGLNLVVTLRHRF